MTQRVLLTGGTGFVGRHIARQLVALGCDVTCVVREGTTHRLPDGIATLVEVYDLFKQTSRWWSNILDGHTHLIHAAWTATPGHYQTDPANLACLSGTLAMAQGAIDAQIAKVIGIGTCTEYRLGNEPLDIDTPLDPETPYAGAKAAAFLALSTSFAQAGIAFAWCRLFFLFGEGEHPNRLVASLRNRLAKGEAVALSQGNQIRDFLDVEDAAGRIVAAALGSVTGPVNICSGKAVTVRDLALQIAAEYGRPGLLQFGARPEIPFDPPCIVGIPTELSTEEVT